MSLWLESAAIGSPLQNLEGSLKTGDSLVESGKDYALSFKWDTEFAKVFKNKGFDLVIGNPPWGASLDDIKAFIPKEFPETTARNLNSFELFVLKSLRLINYGGEVTFVLPEEYSSLGGYTGPSGNIHHTHIRYIADIGPAFEGVTQEGIATVPR